MVETSEEFMKLAYVTLSYEIVSEKRGTVSHSLARSLVSFQNCGFMKRSLQQMCRAISIRVPKFMQLFLICVNVCQQLIQVVTVH